MERRRVRGSADARGHGAWPGRLAPAVLFLVALALMATDRTIGDRALGPLRDVVALVYVPAQRAISSVDASLAFAPRAHAQIDDLTRENARLQAELLMRGRPSPGDAPARGIPARSVGAGGTAGYTDTVTIDAGAAAAVPRDTTVVNADGLVGRVAAVGRFSSVVVLVTDATTSLGARLQGSGEVGVISGGGRGLSGDGLLHLRLLDVNTVPEEGEQVVTLGSAGSRPYVAGVPIGTVVSASKGAALVRPFADLTALDGVAVLAPGRSNGR